MEWVTVIGLLALGLLLVCVEILLVPGTTLVGILGLVIWGIGIALGFGYFGGSIGGVLLIGSGVIGVGVLIYGLKAKTWTRFSLKETHQARTLRNRDMAGTELQVGTHGICRSVLRPVGQVAFGKHLVEARTEGEYLTAGTKIEITRIESHAIYVAPHKSHST